jgi:hypothetical protein
MNKSEMIVSKFSLKIKKIFIKCLETVVLNNCIKNEENSLLLQETENFIATYIPSESEKQILNKIYSLKNKILQIKSKKLSCYVDN